MQIPRAKDVLREAGILLVWSVCVVSLEFALLLAYLYSYIVAPSGWIVYAALALNLWLTWRAYLPIRKNVLLRREAALVGAPRTVTKHAQLFPLISASYLLTAAILAIAIMSVSPPMTPATWHKLVEHYVSAG